MWRGPLATCSIHCGWAVWCCRCVLEHLIRLISQTQQSGWLWAFGLCTTCVAICKRYREKCPRGHPFPALVALNGLRLCSKAPHFSGKKGLPGAPLEHSVPPATVNPDKSNCIQQLLFLFYHHLSVSYLELLIGKIIFHSFSFVSRRSCKESILLTVVQPYPVSFSSMNGIE